MSEVTQLLQGVNLPSACTTASDPLMPPREKHVTQLSYAHPEIILHEPENTAGEAELRTRRKLDFMHQPTLNLPEATVTVVHEVDSTLPTIIPVPTSMTLPINPIITTSASLSAPFHQAIHSINTAKTPRTTTFYRAKAAQEDMERSEKGEKTRKRYKRLKEFYACGKCGKPKNKETNHTQFRGNWYCPHDAGAVTYDEWKAQVMAKYAKAT